MSRMASSPSSPTLPDAETATSTGPFAPTAISDGPTAPKLSLAVQPHPHLSKAALALILVFAITALTLGIGLSWILNRNQEAGRIRSPSPATTDASPGRRKSKRHGLTRAALDSFPTFTWSASTRQAPGRTRRGRSASAPGDCPGIPRTKEAAEAREWLREAASDSHESKEGVQANRAAPIALPPHIDTDSESCRPSTGGSGTSGSVIKVQAACAGRTLHRAGSDQCLESKPHGVAAAASCAMAIDVAQVMMSRRASLPGTSVSNSHEDLIRRVRGAWAARPLSGCSSASERKQGKSPAHSDQLAEMEEQLGHSTDEIRVTRTQVACPICTDDFQEGELIRLLPCPGQHAYHAPCIDEWLVRHAVCPLCRAVLRPSALGAVSQPTSPAPAMVRSAASSEEHVALAVASTAAAVPPLLALNAFSSTRRAADRGIASVPPPPPPPPLSRTTSEPGIPAATSGAGAARGVHRRGAPGGETPVVPQTLWGLFEEYRTRKREARTRRQRQRSRGEEAEAEAEERLQYDVEAARGRLGTSIGAALQEERLAAALRGDRRRSFLPTTAAEASLGVERPFRTSLGAAGERSHEVMERPSSCPLIPPPARSSDALGLPEAYGKTL